MMLTEREILVRIAKGQLSLPPLTFQLVSDEGNMPGRRVDACILAKWQDEQAIFVAEVKTLWTPKVIREAIYEIQATAKNSHCLPMIIVPYLDEETLWELERENVSGVDLCGNGIVVVPGQLYVCRSGNPNQFRNKTTIKNIYRRNSAMVGRAFLTQPVYQRVAGIREAVNRRNLFGNWIGQPMTLSTVSKVLKGLEEDLIVGREGPSIRLMQAEKLLGKLVESYSAPQANYTINWKLPGMPGGHEIDELLRKAFLSSVPAVISGARSVSQYAVMQAGEMLSIYSPAPMDWLSQLPGMQTDRFPTISILQTTEASAYFDPRMNDGFRWASPVQSYLELMKGDKRDQETALQVKERILHEVAEKTR